MKRAAVFVLTAVLLTACATNPATGRTELNLYSEQEEISIGAEAHKEILAQYHVYDEKPELNAMVDRIGRQIAATSPRPNLPWTFTLLDTPMVNAMALPGGYVYVTRGILERMNSEDELAGVIGHEVAHVAAKHAVHSMSTGLLAQVGLVAAAIAAGEEATDRYGALVMIGAGLLFTKYSRQQETEADLLGTDYMTSSGWNPHGAEEMLQGLQRLEGGRVSAFERYFQDHPDPKKRVGDVQRAMAKYPDAQNRPVDRAAFVRRLDGIVTGNSTVDTTIRNGILSNRTFGIVGRVPRGWRAVTESGSLFALYATGANEEVVYAQELTAEDLSKHDTTRAAIRAQLEQLGLEQVESANALTANGQRMRVDRWNGDSDGTKYEVESAHFERGGGAVVLLHIAQRGKSSQGLADLLESFEFGSGRTRDIPPPRLVVGTSRAGDTWTTVAKRATGDVADAAAIANMNGFDERSEVPAGILLKLPQDVVDEPAS